ncbi:MAG: S8 family serine peptidase [Dehalococcoidia bacterium]|nr:S8 family serine peptidase [Dehalococcoidia bacterium]
MARPAWSWQFEPEKLSRIEPMGLPAKITPEWAWEGSTGAGVKVGVIDSGVDASHPAVRSVAGGVALEYDEDSEDEVRMVDGAHPDLFGHGTACAGIIRAVAPEADIYSIRVLGARLTGKGVVFAAGLRWAIDNGMQVVNMSLSTGKRDYFDLFHELADTAYFRQVMLVAAVNNVEGPSYPSQYSSVFSVAAHVGKDPFVFDYNPSPPVEFGAPGIDVEVPWLNGQTIEASGNSFAAPHIAGLIARILGKHPVLTPFQVKTVLHALAANSD